MFHDGRSRPACGRRKGAKDGAPELIGPSYFVKRLGDGDFKA